MRLLPSRWGISIGFPKTNNLKSVSTRFLCYYLLYIYFLFSEKRNGRCWGADRKGSCTCRWIREAGKILASKQFTLLKTMVAIWSVIFYTGWQTEKGTRNAKWGEEGLRISGKWSWEESSRIEFETRECEYLFGQIIYEGLTCCGYVSRSFLIFRLLEIWLLVAYNVRKFNLLFNLCLLKFCIFFIIFKGLLCFNITEPCSWKQV